MSVVLATEENKHLLICKGAVEEVSAACTHYAKESARTAIAALARSGVRVKIVTGDNDIIARKICREVGVPTDDVLLGAEIDKLADQELAQRLETVTVCAKVSPAQKSRIIEALH